MRPAHLGGRVAVSVVALLLVLFGCSNPTGGGGGTGSSAGEPLPPYTHDDPVDTQATLSVSESTQFTSAGGSDYYALLDHSDTTLELELTDIPAGGEVYFVFSNPGVESTSTARSTPLSSAGTATEPQAAVAAPRAPMAGTPPLVPGRAEATEFNSRPGEPPRKTPMVRSEAHKAASFSERSSLIVGTSTDTFILDTEGNSTLDATLRYEDTADGVTLRIWVPDNAYEGGDRSHLVEQHQINKMGTLFLKDGPDNDIRDWVAGLYGEPWGSYSDDIDYLIPESSSANIDILLYDIDDDNQEGGTLGYFWRKDNYRSGFYGSNARLMFYMDSVYYADGESGDGPAGWNLEDDYPAMQISTLAHEFQHMIHWYQKAVAESTGSSTGSTSDIWINEMLSLMAEDFVSQRLQDSAGESIRGPRGVIGASEGNVDNTNGRIPSFNTFNDWPLNIWNGDYRDYSVAYAFGAYLARNFGGEELFAEILRSDRPDVGSIEDALSAVLGTEAPAGGFSEVLRMHPVAVLLSDSETEPEGATLNLADDTAWFGGGSAGMQLGQINHYNYTRGSQNGPWTWSGTDVLYDYFDNTHTPGTNIYVDAGSDGSASQRWKVTLPDGVYLTVVVKG